ncbi:MAG TPA: flagellar filament capping protein FliD [Miltoncostaeaceae bacterium]|nr:flagellar filament capping protein FliD [Miltoncostaeaceae bacterium]
MSSNIGGAGIRFSGLGSGIDTEAMVRALMNYERLPIKRLEDDRKKVQAEQKVVQELNGLATALRDRAAKLFDPGALSGKAATSADEKVVKASAGPAAAPGTYNVTVTGLAQSHTLASGTAPTLTGGTTLEIGVGGSTKPVAVENGDTLQALAERINGTDGVGVSASVVNDRLVLISATGGTAGTVSVGGSAAAALGMTTTQAGADAAATVNGVPVTGSGNRLEGAIAGLTLDLTGVGTTTITVGADTGAIQGQVQGFVDAYNALIRNIGQATKYDAATKTAGTLQGDSTFTTFAGSLRSVTGSAVTGLTGAYDSLAQIGITGSRTGELTLDAAKFQEALATDPNAVRAVFGATDAVAGTSVGDGVARRLRDLADAFSTDTVAARLTGYGATVQRMNDKIARLEDVMTVRETRLRAQFQAMESAIARLQSQQSGMFAQLGVQ